MAAVTRFRTVVADDTEDMRELIVAALEANGRFEVVAQATDAAGAVECVRELRPHLALVDLGMPMVSGLDALPDLREASPEAEMTSNCPVWNCLNDSSDVPNVVTVVLHPVASSNGLTQLTVGSVLPSSA